MPRALVEYVTRSLVEHPESVSVVEVQKDDETVLEVRVAQDDLGKIIGRQGQTVKALRTLLSAACSRSGTRMSLEILE